VLLKVVIAVSSRLLRWGLLWPLSAFSVPAGGPAAAGRATRLSPSAGGFLRWKARGVPTAVRTWSAGQAVQFLALDNPAQKTTLRHRALLTA